MINSNIVEIIEYIINLISNQVNNRVNNILASKLQNIIKVYFKKIKDNNKEIDLEKIEDWHKKLKYIYDKINDEYKDYILFCLKKLFKYCKLEYRKQIIQDIILSKFNFEKKDNSENKIFCDLKKVTYISLIINYILKNYTFLLEQNIIKEKSFDDILISKIFEEINSMKTEDKKIFEKSLLFKIKDISGIIKDKLLIMFKKYYSSKSDVNNHFLNLLMNLYSSVTKEEKEKNLDIIFSLNIECINKKINPIQAIYNLRKILINTKTKEIVKLSDLFNVYPLCKNIINVLIDEQFNKNEQVIKIEGIKLIGLLSGFIQEEDWENEQRKLIIFYLKRYFLNDKKRKVRYATGIVLNLLSCSSPKISFFNE